MRPILIVDDEFGMVETIRDLLQDEGYPTMVAFDGRQALERMAAERPSLVLTDYMMPLMNGPELLDAMKKEPEFRDIPVVIMSSAPPRFWQHLPCTAFLPKPFRLPPLLEVIHQIIGAPPGR
ncbi:response regulator [Cystobacter fuscus DSM 2262]|uniref:Response regulator n=1 Tax=Cystobacter fuscus (strain ATCC 25194 / DSM 2262 / NBRC 100088 / M29) TaxID=1242864 RepID=S9P908_CYSF2|nr:response regulator [Cystobacter fuscus]EPX59586.1 response regulator [Cystobacter fuscus DSM 2262]